METPNPQDSIASIRKDQQEAMKSTLHEIMPRLWLGGYLAAENVEDLLVKNISFVLSLKTGQAPDAVRLAYEDNHIENKRFSIHDSHKEDIFSLLKESCDRIEERLQKGESVLVHCTMGMSRSASVVIAYVIQRWGISRNQALDFVRGKRNAVNPNRGFLSQLKKWESNLKAAAAAEQKVQEGLATVIKAVQQPEFKSSSRVKATRDTEVSSSGANSPRVSTDANAPTENSTNPQSAIEASRANLNTAENDVPAIDTTLVRTIAAGLSAAVIPTPPPKTPVVETVADVFHHWRSQQGYSRR